MKKVAKIVLVGSALATAPLVAQSLKVDHIKSEMACLKANIYFEARGEPFKGKAAVAQVTTNRVKDANYPSSICKTVFQPKQFSWTHQLPWSQIQRIMQGKIQHLKPADQEAYYDAVMLAEKGVKDEIRVIPEDVLHYHATSVNPNWASSFKKYGKIGKHVYYKSKRKVNKT